MRKNKFCKVEQETDLIAKALFEEGMSITQIAKQLKIDRGCLSTRLKKMGCHVEQHCNKKQVLENVFEVIDTEEKAYWLGFLMADGCVSDNNNLELTLKDEEHIEKFKNFLKSNHKISKKTSILNGKTFVNYRISIQNKKICSDLISLGCIPRKTFALHIPNISKHLFKHWLRGFFDGDGCISYSKSQKNIRSGWVCSISSGNIDVLQEIVNVLLEEFPNSNFKLGQSHSCYEIRIKRTNDIQSFLDYIYTDAKIYLNRKYELFTQYCRLETRVKRKD